MSNPRNHWRRRLATGTNALLVAVMVVATVGLLVDVAGRHRARWDLTEDAESTLKPETLATLQAVDAQDGKITITAFSSQAKDAEATFKDRTIKDFLRELTYRSSKIETKFVDFDADRVTAEQLGVNRYGTVVVQGNGDRVDVIDRDIFRAHGKKDERTVDFLGEASIGRAISEVLSQVERKVYVLQGHGEKKVDATDPTSLHLLQSLLQNQGYEVKPLDLLRDRKGDEPIAVPGDASAVLVVGPTSPMTPQEDAALKEYLGKGGSVGYFVDPGGFVASFLEDSGVTVPSGYVMDTVRVFPHDDRPVLKFGHHPIVDDMADEGTLVEVARAAPLQVAQREDVDKSDLLVTSRAGWIERGGDERPPVMNDGVDELGPVTVVAALTVRERAPGQPAVAARLVASGDSELLDDELLSEGPGNTTFAVNTVRWLVGEDQRMSKVGRPSEVRRLSMSPDQLAMVRWIVLALMPLLAVLAGGGVWAMRRNR